MDIPTAPNCEGMYYIHTYMYAHITTAEVYVICIYVLVCTCSLKLRGWPGGLKHCHVMGSNPTPDSFFHNLQRHAMHVLYNIPSSIRF